MYLKRFESCSKFSIEFDDLNSQQIYRSPTLIQRPQTETSGLRLQLVSTMTFPPHKSNPVCEALTGCDVAEKGEIQTEGRHLPSENKGFNGRESKLYLLSGNIPLSNHI